MPYLGDFLGHLLAEITMARVHADQEALRIAEMYAAHPLLRSMPVPRFRLPTVTLDIPVAVEKMPEPRPGGVSPLSELRARFAPILAQSIERAGIVLSAAEKSTLDQAMDAAIVDLSRGTYTHTQVAERLVAAALNAMATFKRRINAIEPAQLERLSADVKSSVLSDFATLQDAATRVQVRVATAELRETGPQEVLTRIRLVISEEGVEWTFGESQGQPFQKLVPE
jgi:hypothetical protein